MPQLTLDIPPDFPVRIKRLRGNLELTQTKLAELMGVSFATVNRWENKQAKPSASAWKQILSAERFGMAAFEPKQLQIPEAVASEKISLPKLDFETNPDIVRVVVEGERLTYGHLFNPTFATELSLIEPLPHQRIAVYEKMLRQPRLRFLLADDAGAGKTIMSGLYIREMLSRRLIRRILIVPPAGLLGNWERELSALFGMSFKIITSADSKQGNPFIGSRGSQIIISLDTLAGERMFSLLADPAVERYDLVVFDEAHKLSARQEADGTVRRTDRYRLAEALAGVRNRDNNERWKLGWSCRHLLLLTATPHMGKDFPYYCLWRLLEPEIFSTFDAFEAYSLEMLQRYFTRRTKEEMVYLDGKPIYPIRNSNTQSVLLNQGKISEQTLYDEVTHYIRNYYNKARNLNRSAARLAMSVFQRRLASSTYALLQSLKNRRKKVEKYIQEFRDGKLSEKILAEKQQKLEGIEDVLDEKTADEETAQNGVEENEVREDQILESVVAKNLAELEVERMELDRLIGLAEKVDDLEEESKFDQLRVLITDPEYQQEKFLIFTEFRDTMEFLVRRLEGLGYTGQIAQIHGGMEYKEREEQVAFFKKPESEGGARFLVATDAAGEGINLQFCWISINYDIPWNPARLEQRMGRIHRFGQKHNPVVILNLVAGETREGKVLRTLLVKLESIRKRLGSDKVFSSIGRIFQESFLKLSMEKSLTDEGAEQAVQEIEKLDIPEKLQEIEKEEKKQYGKSEDVSRELPRLRQDIEQEIYLRLLPGYVRRFVEKAAPLLGLKIEGNPDELFTLQSAQPGAMDPLWMMLETYPKSQWEKFSFQKPADPSQAIFLRPGDPFFDGFRAYVCSRFSRDTLRGGVFVDPTSEKPYFLHTALISVERKADPAVPELADKEVLFHRMACIKQDESGEMEEVPVESLLMLKGGSGIPISSARFAASAVEQREAARFFLQENVAAREAELKRAELLESLPSRIDFIKQGYNYQDAELAVQRAKITDKARSGDPVAKGRLTLIKEEQHLLAKHREKTILRCSREVELVAAGEVEFLAHALVVPSTDPEDRKRYDAEVEEIAVNFVRAWEESQGRKTRDVSKPSLALQAGLQADPGFDLLSESSDGKRRSIEVKGRASVGDVELTENEWSKSCNLRDNYWLYVVYNCATPEPRLVRVRDPFGNLLFRAKSSVVIGEGEIFRAAEVDG